jgi:hypothetical protein
MSASIGLTLPPLSLLTRSSASLVCSAMCFALTVIESGNFPVSTSSLSSSSFCLSLVFSFARQVLSALICVLHWLILVKSALLDVAPGVLHGDFLERHTVLKITGHSSADELGHGPHGDVRRPADLPDVRVVSLAHRVVLQVVDPSFRFFLQLQHGQAHHVLLHWVILLLLEVVKPVLFSHPLINL